MKQITNTIEHHICMYCMYVCMYVNMYVRKLQIKGKESENSYQELKRSQKDRHTQTHGNCIEIFRQGQPSLSIGR